MLSNRLDKQQEEWRVALEDKMTEQMKQAMRARHTVRKFDGTPLSDSEKSTLKSRVDELNKQMNLSIALVESDTRQFYG